MPLTFDLWVGSGQEREGKSRIPPQGFMRKTRFISSLWAALGILPECVCVCTWWISGSICHPWCRPPAGRSQRAIALYPALCHWGRPYLNVNTHTLVSNCCTMLVNIKCGVFETNAKSDLGRIQERTCAETPSWLWMWSWRRPPHLQRHAGNKSQTKEGFF